MANAWESAPVVSSGGWQDAPIVGKKPEEKAAESSGLRLGSPSDIGAGISNFVGKDLVMGAVRGAAGIGATIMQPFQALEDKLTGKTDRTLSSLVTGQAPQSSNQETRAGIEGGVRATGADPSSMAFQTGKLGTEIAGTSGVGGVLAKGASMLPGVSPAIINALRTGGFQAGAENPLVNQLVRAGGGAATGAASAGLVDPSSAMSGGVIGAIVPGAAQLAGKAGQAVGQVMRGPEQTPELAAAVEAARKAGYVMPPTQARPSLVNRVMEGVSGKISTAQNASARNQAVTNSKAAEALGLPADTKLTPDVLADVRKASGQAYDAVAGSGMVSPTGAYGAALDKIAAPFKTAAQGFPNAKVSPVVEMVESLRSPSFDAGSAVAKIKELRTMADDGFRKGDTDIARAAKASAGALEDALEAHLAQSNPQALQAFRDARQKIAKTYSVEKALNFETGSVDARKLAAQKAKGKPLTGELDEAASFAARFPKAAQTPEMMGSLPGTSPLDWIAGGALSAGLSNPLMLASVAARPGARAAALSPYVQNRLVQPAASGLQFSPELAALMYRGAPVLGADR